jgi:hypothetical protein
MTVRGHGWEIILAPETIHRCFEDALRGPLQVAADRIKEVSGFKHPDAYVIVSGGTCRSRLLQVRLRELCAASGLPKPIFTDTFNLPNEWVLQLHEICPYTNSASSLKIAMGISYVVGNVLSPEDFFGRGAAFGIQMRQVNLKGKPNPDEPWDHTSFFLLDIVRLSRGFLDAKNGKSG